ncbi:hypothetical protein [Microbacterium sp. YY-01]|uniref:hypothetical protein n=1 Tax=Microbacterium sp. YY-01 TaxID=3421634 RepID=UPI003D18038E
MNLIVLLQTGGSVLLLLTIAAFGVFIKALFVSNRLRQPGETDTPANERKTNDD